ncbi:sugar phosphate nucleotidyltransferase [Fodinibius sp. N2]|uniref:sugar phosphate nucleotidyltransferase n=1 Tax=Fodinibius alkaliphilus TaxID=3140241 RepID=UPI00315AB44B
MSKVTKAIIPAAGKGERMQPLTNYLSKAMIPLGEKPVLEYIVEELKSAGITDVAVIINSDDEMIIEYFKNNNSIHFIYDDTFSGPGGAILNAEPFIKQDSFVVAFSDTPLKGILKSRVVKNLISLKSQPNVFGALAIYPIDQEEVSKRGVVTWCEDQKIRNDKHVVLSDIIEKPTEYIEHPWASACRYVFDADIFNVLKKIPKDDNGELQLTPAIRQWLQDGKQVLGTPLPKGVNRYDTGNFKDYFEAQRAFM